MVRRLPASYLPPSFSFAHMHPYLPKLPRELPRREAEGGKRDTGDGRRPPMRLHVTSLCLSTLGTERFRVRYTNAHPTPPRNCRLYKQSPPKMRLKTIVLMSSLGSIRTCESIHLISPTFPTGFSYDTNKATDIRYTYLATGFLFSLYPFIPGEWKLASLNK